MVVVGGSCCVRSLLFLFFLFTARLENRFVINSPLRNLSITILLQQTSRKHTALHEEGGRDHEEEEELVRLFECTAVYTNNNLEQQLTKMKERGGGGGGREHSFEIEKIKYKRRR